MPHGAYQKSAECPFYRNDYGRSRRITCEGLVDNSIIDLVFQRNKDFRIHLDTFCCKHYKRCEIYAAIMAAKYKEEL